MQISHCTTTCKVPVRKNYKTMSIITKSKNTIHSERLLKNGLKNIKFNFSIKNYNKLFSQEQN